MTVDRKTRPWGLNEYVLYKGLQCVYVRAQRDMWPEYLILPGGKRVYTSDIEPGEACWPEKLRWEPEPIARVADDAIDPRQMDLLQ